MWLHTFLAAHALRTPDKTALVVDEERITFGQLHACATDVARGLHALGLRSSERIVLYVPNSLEFVTLAYAAFMLGAVVVPVTTRNTLQELAYFVQDSGARVLVAEGAVADELRTSLPSAGRPTLVSLGAGADGTVSYASISQASDAPLPDLRETFDEAVIMYTAGTTGKPKGAVLTHANFVITSTLSGLQWGLTQHDIGLVTTPLAHRTGLARMVNAFCLGATLVVMKRFDVEAALQVIAREGIHVIGMVPTVARMMLPSIKADPGRCASLRHLLVTGEAFPVELKRELASLLPQVRLCSFFAMTEAGAVTALTHEEQFSHPASVGRVTPGIEVRLADDHGGAIAADAVGEIWVRAGAPGRFTTMKQYHGRPRETAEAFAHGWFRTGDLGRFDADGYLYIVDRKKDMVLSGGFNIYTKEVEQALLQHPDIADAAVVGLPDAVFGEAVVAFIQPKAGAALSVQAVQAFCKSSIASYKKPKHVFFRDELPRNAIGKVLKAELRATAAAEAAWHASSTQ